MKVLFISGDYDDDGGKASGYMRKLAEYIKKLHAHSFSSFYAYIEGGRFDYLLNSILPSVTDADIVYWFSHSPANKPHLVEFVKKINPKAILVMLGKNDKTIYTQLARMLTVKANLMVEICPLLIPFACSILDPLGNCFLKVETDISKVAEALVQRSNELLYKVRQPSVSIGPKFGAPDMPEFFEIARTHAKKFHDLIHVDKQDRYLGHLSFRCEHGFPSFKQNGLIFVSKRNVDKRNINANSFVALNAHCAEVVEYYGDEAPSVDSPISIRLYSYYEKIKYMMHSHMYIKDAPTTKNVNPCGAVDEVSDILHVLDLQEANAVINLKGHGSLVMASDLEYLKNAEYVQRVLPEMVG